MSVLTDPVLVLNKKWYPINACTVKAALTDTFAGKTLIVCPETYQLHKFDQWVDVPVGTNDAVIRSSNRIIRAPNVIVNKCNKIPQRKVVFSRHNLWRRDNFTCQYCGIRPKNDEITIDHVIPKHQGGLTAWENCVLACLECNVKKRNRTPEQAGIRLRRMVYAPNGLYQVQFYDRPDKPKWSPIFAIKKRTKLPLVWKNFVAGLIDELYWNTELET